MKTPKTYVSFEQLPPRPGAVTPRWNVRTADGSLLLGQVIFLAKWRRYCFYPEGLTVYDALCLREIAEFMDKANTDRKANRP